MHSRHKTTRKLLKYERRKSVADLYLQGRSQGQIAKSMGVDQSTISTDLKAIRNEWLQSAIRDFNEAKAEELASIDLLEETAWNAWHRSCQDFVAHRVSVGRIGKKKSSSAQDVIERRDGNPKFLERVSWCIETRLKLLGLLQEKGHTTVVNFNWDSLVGRPDDDEPDILEGRIAGILPAHEGKGQGRQDEETENGNGSAKANRRKTA